MINLENLGKSYSMGKVTVRALQNVNLYIGRGEFVALAGPSGSGKTTLLNIIGCIDKPSEGSVTLEGTDVTSVPLPQLAELRQRTLGFIFQTFNLLPVLTAFENVEYPLLLAGLKKKERNDRVLEWLSKVGLRHQSSHRPDQMSGGQRQRVAIARAMVSAPEIVLADEPTANLDSETGTGILDLLGEINHLTGTTFLFATHDSKIIDRAERRVFLRDGGIVADACSKAVDRRLVRCS